MTMPNSITLEVAQRLYAQGLIIRVEQGKLVLIEREERTEMQPPTGIGKLQR
ncbi:MAG: hypothetical protein FWE76_06035 [Symbiobacteriaceae bacterium]|nr:hypothetical protein [Symbiobacteriaceae bacterium]